MDDYDVLNTEAVARRCSVRKVLLKILQNSQENTCAGVSFLMKLQAYRTPAVDASVNRTSLFDCFMEIVPVTTLVSRKLYGVILYLSCLHLL